MFGLVFGIAAMIMAVIGIFVYLAIAMAWGSAAMGMAAGRTAPNAILWSVGAAIFTIVVAYSILGGGQGDSSLENGVVLLIAIFFGSCAMLLVSLIARATRSEEGYEIDMNEQERVKAEFEKSKAAGGWGVRKERYVDNQHARAQKARSTK
jgi:ABC-type transport system involved in multi-copper enzyme maturation permease subunit